MASENGLSCHDLNKNWKPSSQVITFGSLFVKDLPDGLFLPEYPSTFNPTAKFHNDEKYFIHDIPPYTNNEVQYLKPIQFCPMAGNELPMLLRNKPGEALKQHWKKWLPFFPDANMCDLTLEGTGERKCFTQYPLQCLPRKKHAIDPDVHHKILSKNSIPEMGANCPRHMTLDDYTVPCMIKASWGTGGKATYLAKTKPDAENFIYKLQNEFRCPEPVISEFITGVTGNYCVNFYLYKSGDVEWLGCPIQDIDEDFGWIGVHMDWNEQDELKDKLYDTVMPVKEYLHQNGYFGVVGIDVLSNKDGNFVIDVNARINGSTTLVMIGPHMAELGYPMSAKLMIEDVKCTESELIDEFNKINSEGKEMVINLASVETEKSCTAVICLFAKTEENLKTLYKKMVNHECW
ncbi:uncharacterized protein LOC110235109 [Exaiptasia diaphana]|uniref:ATP-grasp domain-containing protein n=1 Tax=Exaiptasia diaphana TaxID=2652724 RepID=A0A913WZ48_EXADI|nr:uncharacterized protein LOC110235109 [Exaiptasia diaphana]KXJ16739.1 hypothetical protein AC249_AIPGENE17656 [Exaiptasia diaphana]